MDVFGHSRSRLARDHALIEPASFVSTNLPGWERTQGVILIAPAMGARFTQYLATMEPGGTSAPAPPGIERFIYVLEGSATVQSTGDTERTIQTGGYAFFPAGDQSTFRPEAPCRIHVFERRYVARLGHSAPRRIVGQERDVEGVPFLGDPSARLQVLLPDEPAYDMAVNIFRFQPGATLPFVEVHVMEHGLLMLAGQGVYRLSDCWYPVRAGDVIWMAPFCPQWFVSMGKEPAAYLYYKDVNRDPLGDQP
jgi:(S)-ureidoglycine aminohydrolase